MKVLRRVTVVTRRDAITIANRHAARGIATAILEHEPTCAAQRTRRAADCDCTPAVRVVTPASGVRR